MQQIQTGIFRENNRLYTRNAVPGEDVYGEKLVERNGEEYREWMPGRSKAGAAVLKGVNLELEPGHEVLYLGAASGTTVSHFSDILTDGFLVAVEYSQDVAKKLVKLAEDRDNIAPIIGDARKPREYSDFVEQADIVYQDISQKDQAEIFKKNCDRYLKEDGTGLIAVKAQSVSSTRDPVEVFEEVKNKLRQRFEVVEETTLEPHEKDHLFLKLEKK